MKRSKRHKCDHFYKKENLILRKYFFQHTASTIIIIDNYIIISFVHDSYNILMLDY